MNGMKNAMNLSSKSVHHFMPYFDEHIVLTGKGTDPFEMLKDIYYGIMAEVKKGNNVFHMEIDCIMVKPILNPFKTFNKIELFTRTSPPSIKYKRMRIDPYMNSGVKYIPADFPRELIAQADEMILDYDKTFWGYDQIVFNFLYFSQHDRAYPMREELNYMPFPDVRKHITKEEAAILHFCSSRGAKECYESMVKENVI